MGELTDPAMEAPDPVMEAPDEPQQRWTTSTQISGWPQRQSVKEKRSTGGRPPLPGVCSRRVVAEPPAPAASTPAPSPATPRQGCAPPAPRDQRRGRSRCIAVGEKERKGRRERRRRHPCEAREEWGRTGKRWGRLFFSYRRIWTQNRKPQYIFDGLAPEQKPDYAERITREASGCQ